MSQAKEDRYKEEKKNRKKNQKKEKAKQVVEGKQNDQRICL